MSATKSVGVRFVSQLGFTLNRLRERLWVKPLLMGLLSVGTVFMAGQADHLPFGEDVPDITKDTIETLLSILSASMLVIAMFAVGAMLSAYATASNAATPRAFTVVVADDVSQNALSVYLGAFIFSVVALIALLNDYYGLFGRFSLFILTILVFVLVIASFVRWMDRIARLGRMRTIVDKVEAATAKSLTRARQKPTLGARLAEGSPRGQALYGDDTGYVQSIHLIDLQALAEKHQCHFVIAARPGVFASAGQPLLYIQEQASIDDNLRAEIIKAFVIAGSRTFDDDPRFGFVVLSEIASRALSPGVNDPGTAIDIIGTLVRLFTDWVKTPGSGDIEFDRISVEAIHPDNFFDDAFNAIARDGADTIEVVIRLQKAFYALAAIDNSDLQETAKSHARYALKHAESALRIADDVDRVRKLSEWTK